MVAISPDRRDSSVAPVSFMLDGQALSAHPGETILQAARRHGIDIPHLCYSDSLRPEGNCRACMVEIEGERVLAPSCCRIPTAGMKVHAGNERARKAQRMVLELLLADTTDKTYKRDSELSHWAKMRAVGQPRFPQRDQPQADHSHPAITVNLDACIQCTRCLRACREAQVNDVIGLAFRGNHAKIVFDLDDPMGESTCVACGECVQACPTGALMPAHGVGLLVADKQVASVCPYCGVGCQLTYHVKDNKILFAEGREGPANHGRLCVKGRYGFDYVHNKQRLTKPLIRREGVPKSPDAELDPGNPFAVFREASWDEALDFAANGIKKILAEQGPSALAGLGSAKGSNEEAYLFQKMVRTAFQSNNVDHCTRLCHASSVVALLEGIGSGAVSNPMADVINSDVMIITGANPPVNHPVGASWMKNAIKRGTKLILLDPRQTELSRFARYHLQFRPSTDVALLNAMMAAIVEEGLVDEIFVKSRIENYPDLVNHLKDYSPEAMAPLCGIPAETIREVARLYANAKNAMILWGMGISQHVHGTDNARCLISLCMITGQIGRPGTGLHPLRGQNNVQGASDVGLIPMVFPDYQRVDDVSAHERFEKLWNTTLDDKVGLTTVEIVNAAYDGELKGLYVEGENPAMSDPDTHHARTGLARLNHLIVQDIFLTETAYFADVVLPATAFPEKTGTFINSDRTVQLGRQAIDPPGEARQDLWIIQEIGKRLGLDWNYAGPSDVFEEMREAMDSIAGITWERLEQGDSVTYPCTQEGDPGEPIIFTETFPTQSGRATLVPASIIPPDEQPDNEYPFVLITGRQLEHWHTGSMTRRASVLDAIEPEPYASLNPQDLRIIDVKPGEPMTLETRRGEITVRSRVDPGTPVGAVFIPFCYYEAAANKLSNAALDPYAKIAEVKYCAVRVKPGGMLVKASHYGGGKAASS